MPGIDSRSAGIEKGQVERRPKLAAASMRGSTSEATASASSSTPMATERTSSNPRNQVAWRLANCRVRAWTRSIVSPSDPSPASMAITSR